MPVSKGRNPKNASKGKKGGRPKREDYEVVNATLRKGLKKEITDLYPGYGQLSAFVQTAVVQELRRVNPLNQNPPEDSGEPYLYEHTFDLPHAKLIEYNALYNRLFDAKRNLGDDLSADELDAYELGIMDQLQNWLISAGVNRRAVEVEFERVEHSYSYDKFAMTILPLAIEYLVHLKTHPFAGPRQQWRKYGEIREKQLIDSFAIIGRDTESIESVIREQTVVMEAAMEKAGEEATRSSIADEQRVGIEENPAVSLPAIMETPAEEIPQDEAAPEVGTEVTKPKSGLFSRIRGVFKP